jgi:hypothetical protein
MKINIFLKKNKFFLENNKDDFVGSFEKKYKDLYFEIFLNEEIDFITDNIEKNNYLNFKNDDDFNENIEIIFNKMILKIIEKVDYKEKLYFNYQIVKFFLELKNELIKVTEKEDDEKINIDNIIKINEENNIIFFYHGLKINNKIIIKKINNKYMIDKFNFKLNTIYIKIDKNIHLSMNIKDDEDGMLILKNIRKVNYLNNRKVFRLEPVEKKYIKIISKLILEELEVIEISTLGLSVKLNNKLDHLDINSKLEFKIEELNTKITGTIIYREENKKMGILFEKIEDEKEFNFFLQKEQKKIQEKIKNQLRTYPKR